MSRDNLYALPRDRVGQFQFDQQVVDVFPDMIARSVPGYASILSVIEQLAGRYVRSGTNVYDLGCSLGAATMLIRQQAPIDATIHAVDNSPAMIDQLSKRLHELPAAPQACRVELHLADLCQVAMSNASMIVLNFTLQFVPAPARGRLLQNCFDAMVPGAALVLSEKVCFDEPGQQDLLGDLHLDFKRACGYSELEIAQKRTSLENTLIPESIPTHTTRLRDVGFDVVTPWFQCFNFVSILAVKQST
ncbi:carboxy-S-adenosyl-L-methionine synthase CmoA [Stieleria sp. TO1_6]|uniref:carboxy-S-adenosyl-L-methionine synthase CmoA n=1 Tax=Stieleria tagensis TaxID=2956795 RepID=UPI00209AC868|nr:carboxy-S-adenosyl-L-methionine synthase CmoA [Stieleria tagensis]MCO8120502.1 carboxy-S-adenosyl-L-methionine synthase CmoA [Stieleria tagensis]